MPCGSKMTTPIDAWTVPGQSAGHLARDLSKGRNNIPSKLWGPMGFPWLLMLSMWTGSLYPQAISFIGVLYGLFN